MVIDPKELVEMNMGEFVPHDEHLEEKQYRDPIGIVDLLSPEYQELTELVIESMTTQLGLDTTDIQIVAVKGDGATKVYVVDSSPHGQHIGRYSRIVEKRKEDSSWYTFELLGAQIDPLKGMDEAVYRAMIGQLITAGSKIIPDSIELSHSSDIPWTATMLTGEGLTGEGQIPIASFSSDKVDVVDFNPDRGGVSMRVRPAVLITSITQSPEQANLPEEYLAKLVFLSYRLSQGGIGTQTRLLLRLESDYYPDLFDTVKHPNLKDLTREMVGRFFLNPKAHPATPYTWNDDSPDASLRTGGVVTEEVAGVFARFDERSKISTFEYDRVSIAQSVIAMDYDYLSRKGGRGGDSEDLQIKVHPFGRDAFDSWFIKYSVLGYTTTAQEYDEIFGELAHEDTISMLDKHAIEQLQNILQVYTREHLGTGKDARITDLLKQCRVILYGER